MAAKGGIRTMSRGASKVPVLKGIVDKGRKSENRDTVRKKLEEKSSSKKDGKTKNDSKLSDLSGEINSSEYFDNKKVKSKSNCKEPVKTSSKTTRDVKKSAKEKDKKDTDNVKKERRVSKEKLEKVSGDKGVKGKNSERAAKDEDDDFSKIESKIFEGSLHTPKGKESAGKVRGRSKKDDSSKNLKDSKKTPESSKRKSSDNKKKLQSVRPKKNRKEVDGSDSDASDWEEVDEANNEIDELEALLNDSMDTKISGKESVRIELDAPDMIWGMKKRKKRRTEEEMIEDYLRRHVNRSIKEVYENMHKTHVLCLFAHGQFVNKALNSEVLMGSALSIITEKNAYPPKRLDMSYLEKFVHWFSRKIKLLSEELEENYWDIPLETLFAKRFESKSAYTRRELVYMFIIIARALGMNVRLIMSLQPMSWKPSAGALLKRIKEEKKTIESKLNESISSTSSCTETTVEDKKTKVKNNRKMLSSDTESDGKPVEKKRKSDGESFTFGKSLISNKKASFVNESESDCDFDPTTDKIKKGPKVSSCSKRKKSVDHMKDSKRRKQNDKEEKEKGRKKSEPLVEWAEIYVEEEEKWICIDVSKAKIHCIIEIEARTPSTSAYIMAFNGNLTVKDVTRRYISSWLSSENKLRCDSNWWKKSIQGFRGKITRLDREEDEEMDQVLRQQPLPKSIGEYKNHPLYALQRHLLKFEAIYPPDETPVGYIKGEPVFPRSSVYTLHSRDIWMKEAKTVRVDEEPYKIVKARPKWDRDSCQVIKDRPLEVFGEWQVEDYEPPVAVGGKVPRNEYGNVELFKPSMLPRGCVHLPISGLNRIARKLNIDCASAITGFDFHSGWSHPVYEGFVVCEEFKDILLDAWNQDQVEQAKRAEEKKEKRIYANWKKLIHGMLVRERVREKYGSYEVPEDEAEAPTEDGIENEDKKNTKKAARKEQNKPKITQEDIDAQRPPLITHAIRNLEIDLTSNVVDMAKASRKSTMKTSNARRVNSKKEKGNSSKNAKINDSFLDDSSDETDEEEKKQRIRSILQWGTKAVNSVSNLSDESDCEEDAKPSCSKLISSLSIMLNHSQFNALKDKKGVKKIVDKLSRSELSDENVSEASSRSTTPECDAKDISNVAPRRLLRRSVKHKSIKYEESDEGGDISLSESDVEDKTFNPVKAKSDGLNLSDSD